SGSEVVARALGSAVGSSVAAVVAFWVGFADGSFFFFFVSDPLSDLPSLTCWIVVPPPPERAWPVASSTAVNEAAAMPNAASAATAIRFQFSFGPRRPGDGLLLGSGARRWLRCPAIWPWLSGMISITVGSSTSLGCPVEKTVFTLSPVRRRDAVYSEPARAAMMLASAAPTTVPATLS